MRDPLLDAEIEGAIGLLDELAIDLERWVVALRRQRDDLKRSAEAVMGKES
jgi:hypothetical protein